MNVILAIVFIVLLVLKMVYESVSPICRMIVDVLSPGVEDVDRRVQLKTLQEELKSISMVNEFAKYAKLERRINSISSDLLKSKKKRQELFSKASIIIYCIYYILQIIVPSALAFTYRSEVLLKLPEDWVFPFGYFIAFPTGVSGAVGIGLWMIASHNVISLCHNVVSTLSKAWLRQSSITPVRSS